MADYVFQERYRKDKRFNEAVTGIVMEAMLRMADVDPEALNQAWVAGVRPLTLVTFENWIENDADDYFQDLFDEETAAYREANPEEFEDEAEAEDEAEGDAAPKIDESRDGWPSGYMHDLDGSWYTVSAPDGSAIHDAKIQGENAAQEVAWNHYSAMNADDAGTEE